LLEGRYLDRADPEKGRFRSFLLTSLKFFVADEGDRERAHKRGGGVLVPLEFSSGEDRYQREPAHDETPERIFERRWALAVLDRVVEKLREEFVQHGRPEHFERLKVFLLGQSDAPYAALAREMNTSEGALKVAIHRLRKRYRELFRQEIADTVADPAEVESEFRYLLTKKHLVIGGRSAACVPSASTLDCVFRRVGLRQVVQSHMIPPVRVVGNPLRCKGHRG